MRKKWITGYASLVDPAFGVKERGTFTCAHCNSIVHVKPYLTDISEVGGWCQKCDLPICYRCVGKDCKPTEKMIEEWEAIGNAILKRGHG